MFSSHSRRSSLRRVTVIAACAVLVPWGSVTAASASTDSLSIDAASVSAANTVEYCQVLLGPELEADGTNEVLARTCTEVSSAQVTEALDRPFAGTVPATAGRSASAMAALASIHLFTMYSNPNYAGTAESIFYSGSVASPCNSSGYSINLSTYWKANVTSFRQGHSSCNRMRIWTVTSPVTYADINPTYPNLGVGGYNDNVSKVNVRHI